MSGTPPVAQLILGSSGLRVEYSDDSLFTRHTFFVFFGGANVGEALAGVFLISVFFPPLALFIVYDFLGWWRLLNAFTLGLVGATSSSYTRLEIFLSTIHTCEHCSTFGLKVNCSSSPLMLRRISISGSYIDVSNGNA
jgi:hypothetical protein